MLFEVNATNFLPPAKRPLPVPVRLNLKNWKDAMGIRLDIAPLASDSCGNTQQHARALRNIPQHHNEEHLKINNLPDHKRMLPQSHAFAPPRKAKPHSAWPLPAPRSVRPTSIQTPPAQSVSFRNFALDTLQPDSHPHKHTIIAISPTLSTSRCIDRAPSASFHCNRPGFMR